MKKLIITLSVLAAALSMPAHAEMHVNDVPDLVKQNCQAMTMNTMIANGFTQQGSNEQQVMTYSNAMCLKGYIDAQTDFATVQKMRADFKVSQAKADAMPQPQAGAGIKVITEMYNTGAKWGGYEE